jgi:NADH dehydrogenase
VQPIHIDELVAGLFALAIRSDATREVGSKPILVLAGPTPITFGHWLKTLRWAHTRKRILLIPVPLRAALLACDLTRFVKFMPRIDRERVLGLVGTAPMQSADDLAALGLEIKPPSERLRTLRVERHRLVREAAVMLTYVSGERYPRRSAVSRLVRAWDRQCARSLGLPRPVMHCPSLLRFFEPLFPRREHRLASRLHLAVMVAESLRPQTVERPKLIRLLAEALLEVIAMPVRLILGHRFS